MPNRSPDDQRADASRRDSRRSFGEEGRYSSDQARYYGADSRSFTSLSSHRPATDHAPWRHRFEAGRHPDHELPYDQEDALTRGYYSLDGPHGGQEFGIEPHSHREAVVRRRPSPPRTRTSEPPYGDQEIDPTDRGVRQFGPPADYAYHPDQDLEFELDYLDWRDEQLRSHDREYADWRAEQQRKYDTEYRTFRSQRRDHFERSFADWRGQQGPLTAPESEGESAPPEDKV